MKLKTKLSLIIGVFVFAIITFIGILSYAKSVDSGMASASHKYSVGVEAIALILHLFLRLFANSIAKSV